MTTQSKALELADAIDPLIRQYLDNLTCSAAAAELRRLHLHEVANAEWLEKTEWIQKSANPLECGMHRADILKQRIDRLTEENSKLWGWYHDVEQRIAILKRKTKAGEQP